MNETSMIIIISGILACIVLVLVILHLGLKEQISDLEQDNHALEFEINALKIELEKKLANKEPSQELTEFLTDLKTHKFGFVRVDPDSVFIRSPKEYLK